MAIHIVFSGNFCRLRKMINLLKPLHTLVKLRFDITACPAHTPFLLSVIDFPKSVIFKCVDYEFYCYVIVIFKKITLVSGFVRSNTNWINVRSKY